MKKTVLIIDASPIYMLGVSGVIEECDPGLCIKTAETCDKAIPFLRDGLHAIVLSTEMAGMTGWGRFDRLVGSTPILLINYDQEYPARFVGMNIRRSMSCSTTRVAALETVKQFLGSLGLH